MEGHELMLGALDHAIELLEEKRNREKKRLERLVARASADNVQAAEASAAVVLEVALDVETLTRLRSGLLEDDPKVVALERFSRVHGVGGAGGPGRVGGPGWSVGV